MKFRHGGYIPPYKPRHDEVPALLSPGHYEPPHRRPGGAAAMTTGFHLHRWTKWQDATLTVSSPIWAKRAPRRVDGQERRCDRCGKRQLRTLDD